MKIIRNTINKEDADLLCKRILWISQTRPRLRELLELNYDPKHSKLAQKIATQLLLGKLILIDRKYKKVSVLHEERLKDFSNIKLSCDDSPQLKIYLKIEETDEEIGPISLVNLFHNLPKIELEDYSLWHKGMENFVNLAELKARVLGP